MPCREGGEVPAFATEAAAGIMFDQKMKTLSTGAILTWVTAAIASDIQLTIEPVTNSLLVTEANARLTSPPRGVDVTDVFPHPDTGDPATVTGNNIVHLPENDSAEAQAWARTNAFRI